MSEQNPESKNQVPHTRFSEEDVKNVVEFLNFVATNSKFNNLDIRQILHFGKLLNYMQTKLLYKIEQHKFEIVDVRPAVPKKDKK
jgi:hypothetical protein